MRISQIVIVLTLAAAEGAYTQAELPEVVAEARSKTLAVPLDEVVTTHGRLVAAPAHWGPNLLNPCSRQSLGPGSGYFQPSVSDLDQATAALAQHFVSNPPPQEVGSWPNLREFLAQAVGVVRGDSRRVYLNYFPPRFGDLADWKRSALLICDGGPSFFGVEIDLDAGSVAHIAFDGCLCLDVSPNKSLERTRER